MSECIPVAKVCDNCACYEVCIYANPGRKKDCSLWKPDMSWVPVSERLPELMENVLLLLTCDDAAVGYRCDKFWRVTWTSSKLDNDEVTHWMPLPEPPKEAPNV